MQRLKLFEKTDKIVRRGFLISLSLLLLSYIINIFNNKALQEESRLVSNNYELIINLETLFSSLKDIESGARGYFYSNDPKFLDQYFNGRTKMDSIRNQIDHRVYDSKTQQENFRFLNTLIDRRVNLLKLSLTDYVKNENHFSDSIVQLRPQNLILMDSVRQQVRKMRLAEYNLLKKRILNRTSAMQWLDMLSLFSLLLALAVFVFGILTYIKEESVRKAAYSEIAAYQQQLKQRVDELAAANKELVLMRSQEKFAATGRIARQIAHEVRNPLTNINLAVDQLKEDLKVTDGDDLVMFDMITRNSKRINQLISDLLNSTKFAELTFTDENINTVLDESIALAQDRIDLNNIKIVKNYDNGLSTKQVDKEKLKIAFLNIIVNAVEALGETENPTLEITTKKREDKIEICFMDNGIGIDNDSLDKLFEPYFTKKQSGMGLGLTNTQNIILNHKGTIELKSKKAEGTTFKVSI